MATVKEQEEEYVKYIENHINNIKYAFKIMINKCKDILIEEGINLSELEENINNHDLSKYSDEEFIPYRKKFFPADGDVFIENEFDKAWIHHYTHNPHHWNHWVGKVEKMPKIYVVEMTLDWIAMGIKFNNTALEYYESNRSKITLSKEAEDLFFKLANKYYN